MWSKGIKNWRSLCILLITYKVQLIFVGDCYGINSNIAAELPLVPVKSQLRYVPGSSNFQLERTPTLSKYQLAGHVPGSTPIPAKPQIGHAHASSSTKSRFGHDSQLRRAPDPLPAKSNPTLAQSQFATPIPTESQRRHTQISAATKSGHAPLIRLNATSKTVMLDNGILQVTFTIPQGFITSICFGRLVNILETSNGESDGGYWDIASSSSSENQAQHDTNELRMWGATFKIISQTENQAEISFVRPRSLALPLQSDIRYVMLNGSSGFYSYAILEREQGWPSLEVSQIRTVYKLAKDRFHYMAVSDKIQRIMPTEQDRVSGQPLAYKEAVLLTNPTNPKLKGEVDDKYQYSCEAKDNKVHGWISFDHSVGVWIITPSDEFRLGGPNKQDLTAHVGPTLLAMFHSTHYGGKDLSMSFKNGEKWKKVFGPYFVHLNSLSNNGDPRTLWESAKIQMLEEVKNWPYKFPISKDFPKANQRGSIIGRLLINDSSKATLQAASAWVGLASPGEVGSWQTDVKGYQFWIQTDPKGGFFIDNIRAGVYNLFAWVPGFIGDFKYSQNITITAGGKVNVHDVVYTPPRNGPTLWEIGVADRSAAEFFVPKPRSNLINRLYIHDPQDNYRQYGLWDRYTDLYPTQDLIYKVNASDFRKDWFYAHVPRNVGDTYLPTTWRIEFSLTNVAPNSTHTLQIALASASLAELQVRINNPDLRAPPIFTTSLIGRDNAIARHGIHGLYRLYTIEVQSSFLKCGINTIFLTQSRGNDFNRGVMYDYLRLEGPSSLKHIEQTI